MQKIKTIQIGSRSFTLKELPVRAVWDLVNNEQQEAAVNMVDRCLDLLRMACPELTQEVLMDLYPSEVEELWQGFQEVNAAFLGVVRRIGLIDILIDSLKPVMMAEFGKAMLTLTDASATSLPPATDQSFGTTDTASS
ncbi:hypothetical protein [Desulfobulbus oligotrophicus]|uniref:Uncharacterized protein n=1 Tax=Desulfobulbus oligotrophicus TaxID=1909699 RepID=A0A7T5VEB2_9BACT|nr:hypothetical protein [Desulfobulbus oligotrophicus]QQG66360.1 hypothetical protein HP555_11015 [Desulfobulbus oligotrophicus]